MISDTPKELNTLLQRCYEMRREGSHDAADSLLAMLLAEATPLIRTVIRRTLGGLPAPDQEDIEGNACAKLLEAIGREGIDQSFRGYTARTAYTCCVDFLRRNYAEWEALHRRVLLLLKSDPLRAGFELKRDDARREECGRLRAHAELPLDAAMAEFGELSGTPEGEEARQLLNRAISEFERDNPDLAHADLPPGRRKGHYLPYLLRAVFLAVRGPIPIGPLTTFLANLLELRRLPTLSLGGMLDPERGTGSEPVSPDPTPEETVMQRLIREEVRQKLAAMWQVIRTLPDRWCAALLLNLRDSQECRVNLLPLFVRGRIADRPALATVMGLSEASLSSVWEDLPIEDQRIAELKETSVSYVRVARLRARERLVAAGFGPP